MIGRTKYFISGFAVKYTINLIVLSYFHTEYSIIVLEKNIAKYLDILKLIVIIVIKEVL